MHQIVTAVLLFVILMFLWRYCLFEHAYLSAPTFNQSLVDKYRSYIKDPKGMTLNDYALESSAVVSTPLSDSYKIL